MELRSQQQVLDPHIDSPSALIHNSEHLIMMNMFYLTSYMKYN